MEERRVPMQMVDEVEQEMDENNDLTTGILKSTVNTWRRVTTHRTDVTVRVKNRTFILHSRPLTSRSGYFKQRLQESNDINLDDTNITAETFDMVAKFCYGSDAIFTPENIAPLRCAAGILEMTEEYEVQNLLRRSEVYFTQAVAENKEAAEVILYKSLAMLPESETQAFLVSRCIEALLIPREIRWVYHRKREDMKEYPMEPWVVSARWVADMVKLPLDMFRGIMVSVQRCMSGSHDGVYRLIDAYLAEHAEMTLDEKSQLTGLLNCNFLSTEALVHTVKNPKMPLRFVIQALFAKQVKNRQLTGPNAMIFCQQSSTLGEILKRDTALREANHLKVSMDNTFSRIESLERDLFGLKKELEEAKREDLASGKSVSFRVVEEELNSFSREKREKESFGRGMMRKLKKAFAKTASENAREDVKEGGIGEFKQFFHHRNQSST